MQMAPQSHWTVVQFILSAGLYLVAEPNAVVVWGWNLSHPEIEKLNYPLTGNLKPPDFQAFLPRFLERYPSYQMPRENLSYLIELFYTFGNVLLQWGEKVLWINASGGISEIIPTIRL